jgi:hypothetical protein
LSQKIGFDFLRQPDRVNAPDQFLECAVAAFVLCGCLPFAVHDDIDGVTYHLNGGVIGLDGRKAWLARWKAALASDAGAEGGTVWAQEVLNALGQEPPLTIDGNFGPVTIGAVKSFQAKHGLDTDGKVGSATMAALKAADSGLGAAAIRLVA